MDKNDATVAGGKPACSPPETVVLAAVILGGIVLRLRQWQCFEFKDDQARAVLDSICALREGFMIPHGAISSFGLPLPPYGNILLGFFSIFGTSTFFFAGIFVAVSLLTLPVCFWICRELYGAATALRATAFLAATPVMIWNASNLWGPSFLPLFTLVFLYGTIRYLETGRERLWVMAAAAGFLGAVMWHLSSGFLAPVLFYAAWRRKLRWRTFFATSAAALLLLLPWLWFLAFQWDRKLSFLAQEEGGKLFAFGRELFYLGNAGFFHNYFPSGSYLAEFGNRTAAAIAVGAGGLFGWIGVGLFCWKRRWTDRDIILVAIAIGLPLLFFVLGIRIYYHYLQVSLVPFIVMAVTGYARLRPGVRAALFGAVFGSFLLLAASMQTKMIRGNGHYDEFGPSGNYLESIAAGLDREFAGRPLSLQVIALSPEAKKKLDPIAVLYIFDRHMQSEGEKRMLGIGFDPVERRYFHLLLKAK